MKNSFLLTLLAGLICGLGPGAPCLLANTPTMPITPPITAPASVISTPTSATPAPATSSHVTPGPFAIDDPMRLLVIFFASVLTNNIALAYFIGMCAFLALSKNTKVAFGMGAAVTFVTGLTAMANWLLNHFVLVPLGLESFQFLVFILTIATIVQFLELFIDRYFPPLYEAFGIFLPLITVNCTVLGTSLFMVLRQYRFWEATVFSFATGLGWMLAILLLAGLRHHLPFCRPPRYLGEIGTALLLAGLMAMAFNGFSGMVKL
ncbi:MAG: Na(+)-translocating NADH-quinone reductase subunit E [Candidatus Ozemobacter sibiricus]|jgi:Na+-transporting NADH:ubiquinone oxidoreductase subunit E|uniref:Na(+)-translocating NADH-quinone reductase subunit E n=1 Tax=Candidatus Ozemobacter sibiricus TaxID=2268124 RepID=A0A367ZRI4_9BACT|nr:MAG: Na(+)-translocating NADH-quinone reductase subunit E [Candidatus Ozemobacter sibiricus]